MKKSLLFLISMISWLTVLAAPATHRPVKLALLDGTTITAYMNGDEHCHFYTDSVGNMLLEDVNGICHKATEAEANEMLERWRTRLAQRNSQVMQRAKRRIMQPTSGPRKAFGMPTHIEGKKRGIVILVNFSNLKMKTANTNESFHRQFNETGYSEDNHMGSVKDFFYDQSYGKFDVDFDVVGPVTLSKMYSYYGKNDSYGNDMHAGEMVAEACILAHEQGIDFSEYDWDSNGEVDQVFVVYAGRGEHDGGVFSTIWPHQYELSLAKEDGDGDGAIELDGVVIDTYAVSNELTGADLRNGIGTACHEFSHCLGLPDTYDTSYQGGAAMLRCWDLMDNGERNGPRSHGETPIGFNAYERWMAGWLEMTELTGSCSVHDMPALNDSAVAYTIYNDSNRNEFFVLENRQSGKWFQNIGGYKEDMHGMMVYHIDYDQEAWTTNKPNFQKSHQRISIIPADNDYGFYSYYSGYDPSVYDLQGDLFPGVAEVTELGNDTHLDTGGMLFNANTDGTYNMNKPVTNIREENGLISFDFMGGGKEAAIENVEVDDEPGMAMYYTLNGVRVPRPVEKGIYIERNNNITKKIIIK